MPLCNRIRDVVVDTNVFVHANDSNQRYNSSAAAFLRNLQDSRCLLCVDEILDLSGSGNKSFIGQEYIDHIRFGSFSYIVLYSIIQNNLIKSIPRKEIAKHKQKVCKWIRNKTDRIFLCVSVVSDSKTLVSNDFVDFQVRKRADIRKKWGVEIKSSLEA